MAEAGVDLRMQMVARLKEAGSLVTPAVEEAMVRVPRHLFLLQVDHTTAYGDQAVMVKQAADGSPISSVSHPTIVAVMLEQLRVDPGHRVLEVGTGSGYNAALLGVLAGDEGEVVGIELEPDLAERALLTLAELGEHRIQVVVGDGRDGYRPRAPYDRVIVTTGVRSVAPAWRDQLANGGRLVLPLVDRAGVGSIIVFDNHNGELEPITEIPCSFLPIRDKPND